MNTAHPLIVKLGSPVNAKPVEKLFAQMFGWELPQLEGWEIEELVGFVDGAADNAPDKVLMWIGDGGLHSFFMSAGGCWRQLDRGDLEFELNEYHAARIVDYAETFQIRGQIIRRIWCAEGEMPMRIQIQLDGGLLTLTEGDWNDPDAADFIRFFPSLPALG